MKPQVRGEGCVEERSARQPCRAQPQINSMEPNQSIRSPYLMGARGTVSDDSRRFLGDPSYEED